MSRICDLFTKVKKSFFESFEMMLFSKISYSGRVFLLFFCVSLIITSSKVSSPNEISRLAAIESLVERQTFVIDDSRFKHTVDKVYLNGHFYSDKPPVLSVWLASYYFLLNKVFGLSFEKNTPLCYYLMTLFSVGVSYAALMVIFFNALRFAELSKKLSIYLTLLLGFGSLIFCYSRVLNNQLIAAFLLFSAYYLILKCGKRESPSKIRVFWVGLLTGFAFCVDIPTGGVFLVSYGVYLCFTQYRRSIWAYLLGVVPMISLFAILNTRITGSLLPPYFHKEGYDYAGSIFPAAVGGTVGVSKNLLQYAFHLLFGFHGLFLFTPVLFFSIWIMFRIAKDFRHPFFKDSLMILVNLISLLTFFCLFTSNYGGQSFGFRWMLPLIPFMFYFLAYSFQYRWRKRSTKNLFKLSMMISVFFAFVGVFKPWSHSGLIAILIKRMSPEHHQLLRDLFNRLLR